ncbi:MAG: hypothetical protein Q8R01_01195 [Ramlibacter sp.]|nr:hypothetical protein [Ramlibacter sp.]
MLTASLMLLANADLTFYLLLFLASSTLFLLILYITTPKASAAKADCSEAAVKFFTRTGVALLTIKMGLLVGSTGSVPIFSEGGSDAYIIFDTENKLASSFLLGIGNVDLIIFAFVLPLIRKLKWRFWVIFFLILSAALGLAGGKKASLFSVMAAVAFGEYLRVAYVTSQRKYFLTRKNIILFLGLSSIWAAWTYIRTGGTESELIAVDVGLVSLVADFVVYQWAYPFFLFALGELSGFFQQYQVDQIRYFFHSILSPLGFPAFSAAIGPALNAHQTGELTGNGINPTFIIEGYVLFGALLPLYAAIVALVIGKGRALLIGIRSLEYRIVLMSLFLPALYILPVDALLFAKVLYVSIFLFFAIVMPVRFVTREKQ